MYYKISRVITNHVLAIMGTTLLVAATAMTLLYYNPSAATAQSSNSSVMTSLANKSGFGNVKQLEKAAGSNQKS